MSKELCFSVIFAGLMLVYACSPEPSWSPAIQEEEISDSHLRTGTGTPN